MKFDKSRVYTALNADELKVGSQIIVTDKLSKLEDGISDPRLIKILERVEPASWEHRFLCDDGFHYALAYLVKEPEVIAGNLCDVLEKENVELRKKNIYLQDALTMQIYTNKTNEEISDKQLTEAKEIMQKLIANAPNTYSGTNIELQQKKMFSFQDAVNKAEQFLNNEVKK